MNILIAGGGGHCAVVVDIVERLSEFRIVGIIDDKPEQASGAMGYPIVGAISQICEIIHSHRVDGVIVAIGDNWLRSQVVRLVAQCGTHMQFPSIIHPRATIGRNVVLGQGTIAMAGVVVNSNARIGEFCILNTNCSVDHDTRLENYVSFAPNSSAGGAVTVEEYSAICLGANVIDRIRIGPHTIVGAGATVLRDLPGHIVAYGTPARKIKDRQTGERYL